MRPCADSGAGAGQASNIREGVGLEPVIESYELPRRVAIAEPCRQKARYPIFRKAANPLSGSDTILAAKLPAFAFSHFMNQNSRQIEFGYFPCKAPRRTPEVGEV